MARKHRSYNKHTREVQRAEERMSAPRPRLAFVRGRWVLVEEIDDAFGGPYPPME
jgi:hypothetical protein